MTSGGCELTQPRQDLCGRKPGFHPGGRIKLFVKLQDKGYIGSTYYNYYYAEKAVLAGIDYQHPTSAWQVPRWGIYEKKTE